MFSYTCCVDYTQSTRLYTDLLHCMHCVVQSTSNYYTIQCKFLPFIWKNLHRGEKFTRTPSLASLTNMRYVSAICFVLGFKSEFSKTGPSLSLQMKTISKNGLHHLRAIYTTVSFQILVLLVIFQVLPRYLISTSSYQIHKFLH